MSPLLHGIRKRSPFVGQLVSGLAGVGLGLLNAGQSAKNEKRSIKEQKQIAQMQLLAQDKDQARAYALLRYVLLAAVLIVVLILVFKTKSA